jgi:hypothetical protein
VARQWRLSQPKSLTGSRWKVCGKRSISTEGMKISVCDRADMWRDGVVVNRVIFVGCAGGIPIDDGVMSAEATMRVELYLVVVESL